MENNEKKESIESKKSSESIESKENEYTTEITKDVCVINHYGNENYSERLNDLEHRIVKLEKENTYLKSKIIELTELTEREKNIYLRSKIPIPFQPVHTTFFNLFNKGSNTPLAISKTTETYSFPSLDITEAIDVSPDKEVG